jgi:hypothetical protein
VATRAFLPEREETWGLGRTLLRELLSLDVQAAKAVPDLAATALADILPELAELRPVSGRPIDPESRRALTLQGAVRLTSATVTGDVLILVDDAQWADASSLDLLQRIAHQVPGIHLLVAQRPEEVTEHAAVSAFLAGLRELGPLAELRLGPLGTEAVARLLSAEARAPLHARLADGLRRHGGDPAEVAHHLAGSGDRSAAAGAYAEAARLALDRFANEEASRLVDQALTLRPDEPVRRAILEVRAEVRARTGELAGARADLREALAGTAAGAARARLLARLAMLTLGAEDERRAAELLDLALTEAGSDPQVRARWRSEPSSTSTSTSSTGRRDASTRPWSCSSAAGTPAAWPGSWTGGRWLRSSPAGSGSRLRRSTVRPSSTWTPGSCSRR